MVNRYVPNQEKSYNMIKYEPTTFGAVVDGCSKIFKIRYIDYSDNTISLVIDFNDIKLIGQSVQDLKNIRIVAVKEINGELYLKY